MQRTLTFVFVGLVSGLALTGCPEKKAEKEPPAAPEDNTEEKAAAEDQEDESADQKKPEEKKAEEKKPAEKKPAAGEKADEGGW